MRNNQKNLLMAIEFIAQFDILVNIVYCVAKPEVGLWRIPVMGYAMIMMHVLTCLACSL